MTNLKQNLLAAFREYLSLKLLDKNADKQELLKLVDLYVELSKATIFPMTSQPVMSPTLQVWPVHPNLPAQTPNQCFNPYATALTAGQEQPRNDTN